ncbi:MAG TPA: metallopeptidase TldD-related protein [Gaiellaceae bacterium]|nr:metallopeptidase TldD-related protein [Gaiellaceae bacterium]
MTAAEAARAALAAADCEAEAVAHAERSGLVRFAGSEVHQPTLIDNLEVTLRVVDDRCVGVATTNRVDADGLAAVAARARAAAANAPVDPDFPGLAEPAPVPEVEGLDERTAGLGPDDQARLASEAIAAADLPVYGFFTSAVSELAVASSTGVDVSQRVTDAVALVVAADETGSGYAEATAWQADEIDPGAVAREAAEKANRTRNAEAVEPGSYAAVLEPYALAELLQYFAFDSLGGLGLLEERSYLSGRIGTTVFDEQITLSDDPLNPNGLPRAFDFEGVPKRRVELVSSGVARGVVWDRATANRSRNGVQTTGHAPPAGEGELGPMATALSLTGGDAESTDELAERIGDGLYITRLHYLGVVDPREGVVTGTTRDGTFLVRDGKIAGPLVNLRFTVSVPEVLRDVHGLTRDVSLVNASQFYGPRYVYGARVPALATSRFHITGIGGAPGI